jgi:hypothetical protein
LSDLPMWYASSSLAVKAVQHERAQNCTVGAADGNYMLIRLRHTPTCGIAGSQFQNVIVIVTVSEYVPLGGAVAMIGTCP